MNRFLPLLGVALATYASAQGQSTTALAQWSFDKAHHTAQVEQLGDNRIASDSPQQGWLRYAGSEPVTLDKNHNPGVAGMQEGDFWSFEVAVDSLPRGERIGIDFCYGGDSSASPYYRLEYYERGRWHTAGKTQRIGKSRYTHRLYQSAENNSYKVLGSFRLKKALVHDTLRIRWVAVAPAETADAHSQFYNQHGLGVYVRQLGNIEFKAHRRILFVGNSYTYYNLVPAIVRELAAYEGVELDVEAFTIGGCTMQRHLQSRDCRDALHRGGYDYAVLQDHSLYPTLIGTPHDRDITHHMQAIVDTLRSYSPNVRPLIEMTWGRRDGYQGADHDFDFMKQYRTMQQRIRERVVVEAAQCRAGYIPVGDAWQRVRSERPELELYEPDGSHPSYVGSYLIAAVIYQTVMRQPFSAQASNGLLDEATAGYLRQVAQESVAALPKE